MACSLDQLMNQHEILARHIRKYEAAPQSDGAKIVLGALQGYLGRVAVFYNQTDSSKEKRRAKELFLGWQTSYRKYVGRFADVSLDFA